jgi:hypothetical protein
MKIIKSILIVLCCVATVYAGSVCFDVPPAHTPRVAEAFGAYLRLKNANGSPRSATQAEVSKACQDWVQSVTQDYERRKNSAAFSPSPVPISASPVPTPTPTP